MRKVIKKITIPPCGLCGKTKKPIGHSARRIGDFYAGLVGDFTPTPN